MDTNWRPIQGGEPAMDSIDWRTQLQPDSRQRIVNKIMDTLKKHLPFSGQEGLHELMKIAERFEEKIYTAATSQSDYLRKISLKMLTMETKSQNPMPNCLPSNPAGPNNRPPPDLGSLGTQSQAHSQGLSLAMPLQPNQSQTRPQLLSQNIPNAAEVQSSSTLSSALPPTSSSSQPSIPSVVGQSPNIQNMPGNSQVRNFITQDGTIGTRKMKRYTSAMPLNVISSANSINDGFKQFNGSETSELESTATSAIKRPKIEDNLALLEETREINQRLIDTVVDISDEDVDPSSAAAAVEGAEGTIVKCSFSAVALSPNLKSQYASARVNVIGLVLVSCGVMILLIFWLFFVRERKHCGYLKHF